MTRYADQPDTVDQMRADFLAALGHEYLAVPGRRRAADRLPAVPGMPDFFVTAHGRTPVAVLFMQAAHGGRNPTTRQADFLRRLAAAGWRTTVAYSVSDALDFLHIGGKQ